MNELGDLTIESVNLVLPEIDEIENIYITGGFSKNELFQNLISKAYPRSLYIPLKLPMDLRWEQQWSFRVQNHP